MKYYRDLETNVGNMGFLLFHDRTPRHVSSTIYLTEPGFYKDRIIYRFDDDHVYIFAIGGHYDQPRDSVKEPIID